MIGLDDLPEELLEDIIYRSNKDSSNFFIDYGKELEDKRNNALNAVGEYKRAKIKYQEIRNRENSYKELLNKLNYNGK